MRPNLIYLCTSFWLFLLSVCSGQGTIIGWKTEAGIEGDHPSTTTHTLLEQGILSRGASMIYSNNSTYTYTGVFPTSSNTRAVAINSNAYYQIAFKAKSGAVLSLSGVTVRLRRANAATANKYCWRYSVDGGTTFNDVGPAEITLPDDFPSTNNGFVQQPIDLSKVCALQNLSSSTQVIFRMYAWGGTSTAVGANLGFGKSYFSSEANNPIVFTGEVEMPTLKAPIVAWRPPSATEDVALPATIADANIAETELSRGTGLSFSSSSTYTYTSIFPQHTSKIAAVSAGAYYQVTMKAKAGYYINLDGLTSRIRRSSAGAVNTYRWAYSLNGTNFMDIGPADVVMTLIAADDTNGEEQYLIDLSSIPALRNVPSTTQITFRLYAWGATANNTNTGFGKSYVTASAINYHALAFYGSVNNTVTLPVKLASFKGKPEGNTVKLNWATASEQNNDRFEILRSSIGKPDTVIGTVKGKGTDKATHNYTYIDRLPLPKTNYYQLRQIDYDGKSELSKIIAVKMGIDKPELKITSSETAITVYVYGAVEGKAQLYITDITGKLLINRTVTLNGDIDVLTIPANWPMGIYIASLATTDGERLNKRFYR